MDLPIFVVGQCSTLLHYCLGVAIHRGMQNDLRLTKYRKSVKVFDSVVPIMMDWAEHRDGYSPVLESIGAMAFDPGSPRFFPEWYTKRRNEYVLSRLLCDPLELQSFLEDVGDNLDQSQRSMLEQTIEYPAFWAYGNILFENDFPLVEIKVDDLSHNRKVVYQELEHAEEKGIVPYRLILAVHNGKFYQSIGYAHSFNTLHPDDLAFLAHALDQSIHESRYWLTQTMNNNYLDFLLLDSVCYHGDVSVGDEYIEMIWETYSLPDEFTMDGLPGKWKDYKKGDVFAKIYRGPDRDLLRKPVPAFLDCSEEDETYRQEPWLFPDYRLAALFFDLERREVAIMANSEVAWRTMLFLLPNAVVDHKSIVSAQHIVSLPIFGAVLQMVHVQLPWRAWFDRIPKKSKDLIEELELVAKTRCLYEEYSEAEEFGLRFALDARCKRVGVAMSVIEETKNAVEVATKTRGDSQEPIFGVTTIPGEFGLDDLPPLTKLEYDNLVVSLEENECFTINSLDGYPLFASLTGGSFVDMVDVETLTSHIEDLFYYFLDEREMLSFMMMNYLFRIFLHTANKWTPVRTFGIELLKLLYPYFEEIGEDDTDAFLSRFSDFVYTRLRTRALVEVKERPTADQRFWGTYDIKPTEFFTIFVTENCNK